MVNASRVITIRITTKEKEKARSRRNIIMGTIDTERQMLGNNLETKGCSLIRNAFVNHPRTYPGNKVIIGKTRKAMAVPEMSCNM